LLFTNKLFFLFVSAKTDFYDVHDFLEDELDDKFNVSFEEESQAIQNVRTLSFSLYHLFLKFSLV
jgi:hypothetical protein